MEKRKRIALRKEEGRRETKGKILSEPQYTPTKSTNPIVKNISELAVAPNVNRRKTTRRHKRLIEE